MAAFERVSTTTIKTEENQVLDIRLAKLPFEKPPITDFDPREHREPKTEIKPWMAYFNLLRTSFGPGMLAIPMAISQAGIVLGPILTILMGLLIIHTHLTLLWCLNEISRQLKVPQISYIHGCRMALLHGPPCLHRIGECAPTIVAVTMIMSQLGICTVLVIMTGDNVRDMMDFQSISPALGCLFIPYMLLEILMKSLKTISYVSMFGNILQAAGMVLVIYMIIDDPHGEVIVATNHALPVMLAIGMLLFNMSAVGVMLNCEKALKNPKIVTKRFGVLSVGIMVPTVVSCVFGPLGYWSFGTMEENILRSLPFDSPIFMVILTIYLIALALVYPLQCYPAEQIIVDMFKNQDPLVTPSPYSIKMVEVFTRPLFVFVTFITAYYLPFQASFIAFVGYLCTSILSLILPALMEIGLLYPDYYGAYNYLLVKDMCIVVMGVTSWCFGVVICGYHLYILLLARASPNMIEKFV